MRIEKWGGLLSNVSPYAIPPGGAAIQINLQNVAPGQISVRGGMRQMAFASALSGGATIRDLYRYAYGTSLAEKLVVYDDTGAIQVLSSPALGVAPEADQECLQSADSRPGGGVSPQRGGDCSTDGGAVPPDPITYIGACCVGGACVPGRTPQQCMDAGGVWMGPNSTCSATTCGEDDGGDGGSGNWPCRIWGGSAFTECCSCNHIYGGNAFGCCT